MLVTAGDFTFVLGLCTAHGGIPCYAGGIVSDENSIISITLTNKNPFIIVDTELVDIDYDSQVIIKLPQKDYSTVNVEITRIYHGFSYSLFKGDVEFAGKLIESEYDYIPADKTHKIKMEISNPYLIKTNENEIILDVTGRKNGRGAYICKSVECFEKAVANRGFERSLKTKIPSEIIDEIKEELKNESC